MAIQSIHVNLVVSMVVVSIMLALLAYSLHFKRPAALDFVQFRSVASAFCFQFVAWIAIMVIYWTLKAQPPAPGSPTPLAVLILNNLANVATIGAAIAYARGSQFKPLGTVVWLLLVFVAMVLWGLAADYILSDQGVVLRSIAIAPGVVVSAIAIVGLGWVFYARWGGWAGTSYFLISVAYAVLQLPVDVGLLLTKDVDLVFSLLAGGKVPLAYGFLAFILSSDAIDAEANTPKAWPTRAIEPPRLLLQIWPWLISFIGGIVSAAATEPLAHLLREAMNAVLK